MFKEGILSRNLERLSSYDEIDLLFEELDQIEEDFSKKCNVPEIKRKIASGSYQLSPLRSERYFIDNPKKSFQNMEPIEVVRAEVEDDIVYRGLSMLLEKKLMLLELKLMKTTLAFRRYSSVKENFEKLSQFGRLSRIVHIQFSQSMTSIEHSILKRTLEQIVGNKFILQLLDSFLILPILDKDGNWKVNPGRGIPLVDMISTTLLNLVLWNFDREFQSCFPTLPYFRILDDAFVAFPWNDEDLRNSSTEDETFFKELECFFVELRFDGEVSFLKAGNLPVPVPGGFIFINEKGFLTYLDTNLSRN